MKNYVLRPTIRMTACTCPFHKGCEEGPIVLKRLYWPDPSMHMSVTVDLRLQHWTRTRVPVRVLGLGLGARYSFPLPKKGPCFRRPQVS